LLKAFITQAELETGQKVKALCSDGGGECIASHVQQYLKECGIKHKVTTADTPQHNGMAEHLNCTLLDKSYAMLTDTQLLKSYWLKALNYATFLHNVSPSHSITTTLTKVYTGTKLDVSQLQVFGCIAHAHILEKSQDKLSAHSLPCTFLGFSQQCSAFHLMHRPSQRFIESYDIVFDEGGPTLHQEHIILKPNANNTSTLPTSTSDTPSTAASPTSAPFTSCPKCTTCPPIPDDDPCYSILSYGHHTNIADTEAPELKMYDEAIASPDATEWLAACKEEMQTWKNLDIYDVVP
jgi:hypothetical protein